MRPLTRLAALASLIALIAACTGSAPPSSTAAPSASPSGVASSEPSAEACSPGSLATKADGRLTIGTDNPAYPPYFDPPADGETAVAPWELGDPTNGRGFESAVAYAIAAELGYSKDQVEWVVVPFNNSYAPGPKDFDFDINQVSYSAERAQTVDLSDGYYFLNQSLVAVAGTPIADATTMAALKEFRFGAQVGTTSLTYIEEQIQPTAEPMVYDTNDAAISAIEAGQIDGLVVDLPTAFFVTAAQMDDGVIVGQFPPAQGEQEHFSLVLEKDSPLTECVNGAIAALKDSGELDSITQEWLADKANAPTIQP